LIAFYIPGHRSRTTIATIVPLLKVQGTIHTLTHSRSRCLASPGTSLASSLHTARQRLAKTRVTTPLRIRNYTLTHTHKSLAIHPSPSHSLSACMPSLCFASHPLLNSHAPHRSHHSHNNQTEHHTPEPCPHTSSSSCAMPDHTIHLTPCPLLCACLPAIVSHIVRTTE